MMELAQFLQLTEANLRWRVACHEAGHVAALYHTRRAWSRVHVIPAGTFLGLVEGVRTPRPGATTEIEDHLLFLLAGKAAVRLFLPHSFTGGWTDELNAWRWAGRIADGTDQRAAAVSHARAAAEQLCAHYRPAIQALADTLVQVRELDKRSACRILREAMDIATPGGLRVRSAQSCPCSPLADSTSDGGG